MNQYTKVIGLTGTYYTKEFVKKKHHKNKVREVKPETVAKVFLEGNAEVLVYFLETDKEILITPLSSPEDIKKYLGKEFIS
ncbi:hypothetical protein [Inediibacterium massiliense]|uniref:hypothetical protein n=1 Tax=Inediibacterium massiliense TaxID=1658111 RepID=UPI0006B69D78|nr:hypothetical protein [Inediibacterium massiliense]